MALARLKNWIAEVLTHTDLNNEFNNIINNPVALISPFTGSLNGGGQDITNLDNLGLTSATFGNAGVFPSTAGQLLRNGAVLMLHDGTVVRINQCLEATGASGIISATAAETSLYSYNLFGGALGTSRQLQTKIMLRIGLLSGASVQILCYYGGTLGASLGIGNSSASTADFTLCPLLVTLSGNQTTSDQIMMAECRVTGITSTAANVFASVNPNVMHGGGIAEDSTIAQAFQVNVLFSAADAANRCDYTSVHTMLVG